MKPIIKIVSQFIFVSILLFSCQVDSEKHSANRDNFKIEKRNDPSPKVEFQSSPTRIQYSWLSNFDSKSSLLNQINPPPNFKRVKTGEDSFAQWLQFLPLFSKEKKVELYNGNVKSYQGGKERVINIDIGKQDLQQCADAVMRLRSEYFFGKNDFESIHFNYTNGTNVSFEDWRNGKIPVVNGNKVTFSNTGKVSDSYSNFKKYLLSIFMYAGTASLEKEMKTVSLKEMKIGDVLIQGGHPGHAILVIDMAENSEGEKLFLLAQSYMPAQNIHVLKNPMNKELSPWYELTPNKKIETPEWDFNPKDLKRFAE